MSIGRPSVPEQNSLELPGQRSDLGSGAQTRHLVSLSLINCFHRIAGAGADIAELVAATRPGGGGASPPLPGSAVCN